MPLRGVRVVTIAQNVPGPVAAAMLAERGANVVKIEPPSGDPLAAASPEWYAELHRGVEVQRLDLKSDPGRAALDRRLATADLLLTSSRPAALERLGLSWPALHPRLPRLCLVSIVGHSGSRANEPGHDLTYQAEHGLVRAPALPVTLIADLAGAQHAVIDALALLLARERGGASGHAEVALADCARRFAEPVRRGLTAPGGWLGGANPEYCVYRTSDGWIAVAALEPHFRERLARELGVALDDRDAVGARFLTDTSAGWQAWGRSRDLPMVAVSSR
jgi:alpha-methylacyl-CoA racemase